MRRSFWRILPALLLSLLAAACSDLPTAGGGTEETAKLGFALNVSNTTINTVSVEVTGAGITQPLVYNIPVSNGTASGSIDVQPGSARTITVRAFDAQGVQTHEGSTTVDVKPGSNPPVTVTLIPRAGSVPIEVSFGSVFIQLMQVTWPDLPYGYSIGSVARFEAVVMSSDGTPIPGATVRWASLDPSVMSMTQDGQGYANAQGTTDIVATWNGYGAAVRVNVAASGPDYATPELHALTFDQSSVRFTGMPRTVLLNVQVTDDVSGVASVQADIRASSGSGAGWTCNAAPTGTPGLWRCAVTVDAYTPLGEYKVKYLTLMDNAGNGYGTTDLGLAGAGFSAQFTVIP